MRNWKTTAAGILAALAVLFNAISLMFDYDPTTNPDWAVVVPALVASIGLIFAKDFDKTGV